MHFLLKLITVYILFTVSTASVSAQSNRATATTLIPVLQLLLDETPSIFQCKVSLLADLNGHYTGGYNVTAQFTDLGDLTLFLATHPDFGTEMWVTDGTVAGTRMLKDIMPGAGDGVVSSLSLRKMERAGSQIFFFANDGTGIELWVTDGTSSGTRLVKDISTNNENPAIGNLTAYKGKMYFRIGSGSFSNADRGLWVSDGTNAGTSRVKEFHTNGARTMAVLDEVLIFTGDSNNEGLELWQSDGTPSGTQLLTDINTGGASSSPAEFSVVGDKMYFTAHDGSAQGRQLWVTDGTGAGTIKLSGSSTYSEPDIHVHQLIGKNTGLNGVLYFSAYTNTHGYELWKTDGTPNGTVLAKDTYVGARSGLIASLGSFEASATFNDQFFFQAETSEHGSELWSADDHGVVSLVNDLYLGNLSSSPRYMVASDDYLFFDADFGSSIGRGDELTIIDKLGRTRQIDVIPGGGGSHPEDIFVRSDQSALFISSNQFYSQGPGVGLYMVKCPVSKDPS